MGRHFTYIIAILLAVLVALLIKPVFHPTTRGLLLPASEQHFTPYTGTVKMVLQLPTQYTLVGLIRLQRNYDQLSKADERDMIQKARQLAAKGGANAIWINGIGHSGSNDVLGKTLVMRVVALRV